MPTIVTIAGCPSITSRATAVLGYTHKVLARADVNIENITIRQLPSDDLLLGRAYSTPIRQSNNLIKTANGVVIAVSVCKRTYNGGLKAFFDLLPPDAFRGKVILPIALGATPLDFPEVDHSLSTVLTALGANHILEGVYLLERQVKLHDRQVHLDYSAQHRIQIGISSLLREIAQRPIISPFGRIPLVPLAAAR